MSDAGNNGHHRTAAERPPLDVARTFEGKTILLIGTTGFVGKVALSMLLDRYPGVGRIYCLVRPGAGNTADERFYRKVASSPAFDPLRERHGAGFEAFLRTKIVAIPGDIGRPECNFTAEQFAEFEAAGGIDVIINSAGLVSFMPSLESGLRINTIGAKNVLDVARRAKAKLVHISTCYVAGMREGEVWEDEAVVGYFPRRDELRDRDFDANAEIADCQRTIEQVRERANDRAHISEFRERAAASLEAQRRDPDDEADLKLAVARERKLWINQELTRIGMERSLHWGWTNTYTYTKSLGEQIVLGDPSVAATVVRPAVVESALRFPFPGWNEGFNTTAPLVYLMLKGHRQIVAADTRMDIIPVDFVAAGMLLATAAILDGSHEPVYQLGTSDSHQVTAKRFAELTSLAVRGHYRDLAEKGEDKLRSRLRARLEAMPVSYERFQRTSAPLLKRLAEGASQAIDDHAPTWGAPRIAAWAERAKEDLAKVSHFTGQVIDLVEMFKPFNYDRDIAFRADNIRALWRRVTPADQDRLWWSPPSIDWREYWLKTHFPGLKKWVFPTLDEEFGQKPRSVYTYKDLLELFDATTKLHKHRVAFRLLPSAVPSPGKGGGLGRGSDKPEKGASEEPVVFTYGKVAEVVRDASTVMIEAGIVSGDRVMLMSENCPEWGISYFSILRAGATAVPLDSQLSPGEVRNLARVSGAKILIVSAKVARRLCDDAELEIGESDEAAYRGLASYLGKDGADGPRVWSFDQALDQPRGAPAPAANVRGDSLASIIFTSGTTGQPKGVMLTHKNFTSVVAKLASLFSLYRNDNLLSVLPMHHTFEFSTGFLMPLMHGASITYLEEVEADALSDALSSGNITGLVGVPALWQLFERKIWKTFSDRGALIERAFDSVVDWNRSIRDGLPWSVSPGKLLFFPIHRKLGGRLRLLISGGSALPVDTYEAFRGLGFDIYEGYGMTEAAPVITVHRQGEDNIRGSVGRALPGVDVRIDHPDENGVGEVVAKGPNVMLGYYENPEATAATLKDGWLHTGDLGKLDGDGNLTIVGRKKEMILGPSGENVYPDELEELYLDSPYVKEVSVVGLPSGDGHETVAALIVPEYDQGGMEREAVREAVREHVRKLGKQLPLYKRVKVFHLWDLDLPKTSTRKVKRREVIRELERLERAAKNATEVKKEESSGGEWVRDLVASVSQKKRPMITAEARLADLGFDSLMVTELGVALEAAGVVLPDPAELSTIETVADLEQLVARLGKSKERSGRRDANLGAAEDRGRWGGKRKHDKLDDDIAVPSAVVRIGRSALRRGQRALYENVLDTAIHGKAYVPPFGGYIVAANHASHLDMGLCKYALGEQGDALVALAAKDYFFDDPVRRMYFENFTNLVPMERYGSLRESLRLAADVIRQGYVLLIFPEGTRSPTGVMTDFKPSLGYLALTNKCGILPIYCAGTYEAMPRGRFIPTKGAEVAAHVAPFQSYESLVKLAAGKTRAESYRAVSAHVEGVIRKMVPKELAWTLGDSGTEAKKAAPEPSGHGHHDGDDEVRS